MFLPEYGGASSNAYSVVRRAWIRETSVDVISALEVTCVLLSRENRYTDLRKAISRRQQ